MKTGSFRNKSVFVFACNFPLTTVELICTTMNSNEYIVSLETGVVITKECNAMFNRDESIGTTNYLTL